MEQDLTIGRVSGALTRFVLPFLAASILQFLYSVVDMIIVGQFSDSAAISAVNTAGQIMLLVTGLVSGIATGGTVLIGQAVGGKKPEAVRDTIHSMTVIFLVAAVVLTGGLLAANHALVSVMQVPEAAVVPARSYLWICSLGSVFIVWYNGVSGILRGLGDSKHPMYFVACSCILNIIGDLILVGGFSLGASGAALATVLAQGVACVMSLYTLQKGEYRISGRIWRYRPGKILSVLRLGIPVAAQDGLTNLSFLLITAIVNAMGLEKSAAVGVVERIIGFCMLAPIAFLSALSAFTAQNMGAGKTERTKEGLKISIGLCASVTAICFLLCEAVPSGLVHLFTQDMAVIQNGTDYLRTYSLDIFLVAFVFCLNGFFAGYGKTGFTMANCVLSTFLIRVPLVYAISRIPGVSLTMIGLAAPLASVGQIIMQLIYYRMGKWRGLETKP